MTKPNFIFKVIALSIFCFISLTGAFAQTEAKASADGSYEAVLQVVVGSNDAAPKNNLPANLAAVTKNLKNNFAFTNYSVSDTYIGRVANTGSIEYKTLSDNLLQRNQPQSAQAPVFLDWTLGSVRAAANGAGRTTIQVQPFRFGARVPVASGNGVINYESIGLTMHRVNLPENVPTLIGTLPTPKTGETIFLVLTVKSIEE